MFKCTILMMAVLLSTQAWSATEAPEIFTVAEAVKTATEKNPSLQIQREKVEDARLQWQYQFRTVLFPQVSAYFSAATKQDMLITPFQLFGRVPYNYYQAGFEATYTILKGTALWDQLSRLNKDQKIAAINLQVAERDLTVEVLEAYFNLALAQRKVETYKHMDTLLKDMVSRSSRRERMGTERRIVVLQFKTQQALNTPKLQQAETDLRLAASQLASVLNLEKANKIGVKTRPNIPALLAIGKKLREQARDLENRLELEKLGIQVEQISNTRAVTLSDHYPRIDLAATYGRAGTRLSQLSTTNATAWTVSAEITIPLFSGLNSFTQRAQMAQEEKKLELELAKNRNTYRLEWVRTAEDLTTLGEQLKSAIEAHELSQSALKEAQLDYAKGANVYTQVYESQRSLVEARLTEEQTIYSYLVGLAKYCVAHALPLDEVVQAL